MVQGSVKTWSKYVAQHNGPIFDSNNGNVTNVCLLFFYIKNHILPAERKIFGKKTKREKKRKLGPGFDLKKAFLDQVLTLQCPGEFQTFPEK